MKWNSYKNLQTIGILYQITLVVSQLKYPLNHHNDD